MGDEGRALGEGLYWMAEKLRWGYEDVARNLGEALRLYRQAADLGISDAHIRIGEFFEQGHVVDEDPAVALKCYKRAYDAGNPYGHAAVAKLLARTDHYSRAERHWAAAFMLLDRAVERNLWLKSRGLSFTRTLAAQLKHQLTVDHLPFIRRNRHAVLAHHMRLVGHAKTDERLEHLQADPGLAC